LAFSFLTGSFFTLGISSSSFALGLASAILSEGLFLRLDLLLSSFFSFEADFYLASFS
jgi:hypothetical protein